MLGCAGLGYPQHGASHVTPLYQPRCLGSTCIRRLACRWQRQEKQQLRNPAAKAQPLEDFVALDVEFVHFKCEEQPFQVRPAASAILLPVAAEARGEQQGQEAQEQTAAAWVAVVDGQGKVLLNSYCLPEALSSHFSTASLRTTASQSYVASTSNQKPAGALKRSEEGSKAKQQSSQARVRWTGGVQFKHLQGAPPVAQVAAQVVDLAAGRLLVGHGLAKDLKSLGALEYAQWLRGSSTSSESDSSSGSTAPSPSRTDHSQSSASGPRFQAYDTMDFRGFQGKGGTARSLRRLAQEHLGIKELHKKGVRHDPVADAKAVGALYRKVVLPALTTDFNRLVGLYEQQLMEEVARRRAALAAAEEAEDAAEAEEGEAES